MIKRYCHVIKAALVGRFADKKINYNIWVFSSTNNKAYNFNSKYLFEYVKENLPEITPLYVINDDVYRGKLQKKYGADYFIDSVSVNGIRKVLSAGVWFTSAGLPVYGLHLNKKRLIINLWHGIPLKKIALQEEAGNFLQKLYFKSVFSNNYTYIITTSSKLIEIMCKSFAVPLSNIKVWGQPRNDLILAEKRIEDLRECLGNPPDFKKIILYAPTYRDKGTTILFPFVDFEIQNFNEFLRTNEILMIIRTHAAQELDNENLNNDRVVFLNSDRLEDISNVLNVFDLLITDYSSIYIDYLLTLKPVLFLPYDIDSYMSDRGFNFEYEKVTPGPKPETFKQFKDEILKLLTDENYFCSEREYMNRFFNEVQEYSSPLICKNIIDEIGNIKEGR